MSGGTLRQSPGGGLCGDLGSNICSGGSEIQDSRSLTADTRTQGPAAAQRGLQAVPLASGESGSWSGPGSSDPTSSPRREIQGAAERRHRGCGLRTAACASAPTSPGLWPPAPEPSFLGSVPSRRGTPPRSSPGSPLLILRHSRTPPAAVAMSSRKPRTIPTMGTEDPAGDSAARERPGMCPALHPPWRTGSGGSWSRPTSEIPR